jgi:hypothetical protein
MTYADLIAEIKLLSKRGDVDDKIAIALRMTTLRCHRLDYFWRDLVEANLLFAADTQMTLDTSAQLTRFRQMSYMRYYDPDSTTLGPFVSEIDASDLLDEYNYYKEDRYYLAGVNLQARFQYVTSGARIGYWQNPDVTSGGYNSWIKDQLPDILVQGSLAYLFNLTGKQEEARALNRMVGLEPDPTNKFPGMTLVDQLRANSSWRLRLPSCKKQADLLHLQNRRRIQWQRGKSVLPGLVIKTTLAVQE